MLINPVGEISITKWAIFINTEKLQGVVWPAGKAPFLSTIPSKIAAFVVDCPLPRAGTNPGLGIGSRIGGNGIG
jgi:hypothetical protein